jgi:hypothetical protein
MRHPRLMKLNKANINENYLSSDVVSISFVYFLNPPHSKERLLSKIGKNIVIRRKGLSEEVRSLMLDLKFVTRSFGLNHMVLIDILCLYGAFFRSEHSGESLP